MAKAYYWHLLFWSSCTHLLLWESLLSLSEMWSVSAMYGYNYLKVTWIETNVLELVDNLDMALTRSALKTPKC